MATREATMGRKSVNVCMAAVTAAGVASAAPGTDFEALRAKLLNRPRQVLYNTDGCDALYFPAELPATAEALEGCRLVYTRGTRIDTVLYCPISSGFGHLTCRTKAGDQLLANPAAPGRRNVTRELLAKGTDPLAVALGYCRREQLECFVSLRFNDTHDSLHTPEKPSFLMPPYKLAHPNYLMGTRENPPPRCHWSAVDFTHPEIRRRQAAIVREICTNYDVDGIEYDFMRHMQLLKSVAWDGVASAAELAMMTKFMGELRAITEEIGRRRGRPILVAIRVPDSAGYCRAVGIDLERWLKERLVDIVIGGGYFQLNKWRTTAALVHRHGAKFYASLDESRIRNPQALKGRGTPEFYYARIAAAMADGCDGVYHFNLERGNLNRICKADPLHTEGLDKLYFATERGSGGYRSWHFLKGGARFNTLPAMDPNEPLPLKAGKPYEFSLVVGDDLAGAAARGLKAAVTVEIQTNLERARYLEFQCNGWTYAPRSFRGGRFVYDIPSAVVACGDNSFRMTPSKDAQARLPEPPPKGRKTKTPKRPRPVANDFVLKIAYKKK